MSVELYRESESGEDAIPLKTLRNRVIPGFEVVHKPLNSEERISVPSISTPPKPLPDSASGQADLIDGPTRRATEDSPFHEIGGAILNGTSEATTEGPRFSQYDSHWWYLEILGILASIAAMVSVITILHLVQDRPLHDWNFLFQPNTVLSALVTTSKSAMLFSVAECLGQLKWVHYWHCKDKRRLQTLQVFDEASRGPWGSIKFYFGIRNFIPIGALASFVVISALGMEPFTQQIISFRPRFVDAPGEEASILISNLFNVKHNLTQLFTTVGVIDAPLQGAFYRGLFDMNTALDFTCASSNCTWPDFSTLALCSTCEDVTALTKVEKQNCTGYDLVSDSSARDFLACDKYLFTTPSNGELAAVVGAKNGTAKHNGEWLSSVISTQLVSSNSPVERENDYTLSNVINLAKFQWNSSWSFQTASRMMATGFEASQCSISWCVKRYIGVNVTNGALNNFSTEDIGGRLHLESKAAGSYVFAANAPSSDVSPWANASNFYLDLDLYTQVLGLFVDNFAFNFTNQPPDKQFENLLVFLQNTNTSGIIQNIAASITDRIRHNSNDVFLEGSSLRPIIYITVEWLWIILPVGAVLLSTTILGVTVWINHRHNAPLWKSGLMPLLFLGLNGWNPDDLRIENRQEMEKRAKEMHACLQRGDDGDICFVGIERS